MPIKPPSVTKPDSAKQKPTKPKPRSVRGRHRSCRRCPGGEDGVGRTPKRSIKTTHTESHQIWPEIGRSNGCRRRLDKTSLPVTQERFPGDGQGHHSSAGVPHLTGKAKQREEEEPSPPAPAATARNRRRKDKGGEGLELGEKKREEKKRDIE